MYNTYAFHSPSPCLPVSLSLFISLPPSPSVPPTPSIYISVTVIQQTHNCHGSFQADSVVECALYIQCTCTVYTVYMYTTALRV